MSGFERMLHRVRLKQTLRCFREGNKIIFRSHWKKTKKQKTKTKQTNKQNNNKTKKKKKKKRNQHGQHGLTHYSYIQIICHFCRA